MNSKKVSLSLFVAILLIGIFAYAYANNQLDKYLEKYDNIKTFSADFIQKKYLSIMNGEQISNGYIRFIKDGKRMIFSVEKPYAYKFILKDNILIKYYPDLDEKKVYNLENDVQMRVIFDNIFILMGMKHKEEIQAVYDIVLKENNTLVLLPKNESFKEYVSRIVIKLNKDYLASSIKIIEPSQDYTLIEFTDIQINKKINKNEFEL